MSPRTAATPVLAWTNLVFTVQATETNTLLQFGAENPPDGFGLDDISLVALAAPVFTSQPTNQTVLVGNPAALSGSVRGIAPLAFQWFMNGTNLASAAAVAGATSNVLVFSPAAFANSGSYSLVVTNNYGAVTSSLATLTVVLPPGFSNVVVNPDGSCRLDLLGTPAIHLCPGRRHQSGRAGQLAARRHQHAELQRPLAVYRRCGHQFPAKILSVAGSALSRRLSGASVLPSSGKAHREGLGCPDCGRGRHLGLDGRNFSSFVRAQFRPEKLFE